MPIEAGTLRRLEAMDIQVWCVRDARPAAASRPPVSSHDASTAEYDASAASGKRASARPGRIRLEAGGGRWLLVVDDADRARHAALIEDIRAALGTDDCRFGTWSDSAEAGLAAEDWDAHGIRHALVFGGQAGSDFVQAGDLSGLAASGKARRALWQRLQPLLAALEY